MTTLGATRANHRRPTTSAHAYEEAMSPLAAHHGRLISTFHGNFLNPKIKPWITAFSVVLVKKFRNLANQIDHT
jgi:hypothetical protein